MLYVRILHIIHISFPNTDFSLSWILLLGVPAGYKHKVDFRNIEIKGF